MKTLIKLVRWISAFLAWCLFLYWWREAATPGWVSPRAVLYSLLFIVGVVAAAIAYSTFWILHNKRLANRGKRGFVSFYKPPRFEADALGRRLKLEHEEDDRVIVIRNVRDHKEYLPEPTPGTMA